MPPPQTSTRPLRVLICSGNLGNARPDEASIAEWLPLDGSYGDVVDNQQFPLPSPLEQASLMERMGNNPAFVTTTTTTTTPLDVVVEEDDDEAHNSTTEPTNNYFDLIVIGMQEATFDVKDDDPIINIPVIQPLYKKTLGKAVSTAQSNLGTLAKSRDHLKSSNALTKSGGGTSADASTHNNPLDWLEKLEKKDSRVLQELLSARLPSYDFIVRFQRGEMRLEILVRKTILATIEATRVGAQNTGLGVGGVVNAANKGGIVAELLVNNTTRMTFCTAHLQAHEGNDNYKQRCRMVEQILDGTADSLGGASGRRRAQTLQLDSVNKSHFCFFMGDLNFRTRLTLLNKNDSSTTTTLYKDDMTKEEQRAVINKWMESENWRQLNQADELFFALRNKDEFVGFNTLPCFFPPTFKLDRVAGFSHKDQRLPSYTDRILFYTLDKLEGAVHPKAYGPVENFTTSDHKPVRGAFEIDLNVRIPMERPKMRRRRSMFNMSIKNPQESMFTSPDKTETLHLFISDIRCTIKKRESAAPLDIDLAPDPYVSFISLPKELVKSKETKWSKFKGLFRFGTNLQLETIEAKDGGQATRTVFGYPRTRKLTNTFNPDWTNETIHLQVNKVDKKGRPLLDISGAILLLCLLDHSPSIDDNVIGCFPLNLAHLWSMQKSASQQAKAQQAQDGRTSFIGSMLSFAKTKEPESYELLLDEPLVKNGKETGRITCKIDCYWMDVETAKVAVNAHQSKKRLSMLDSRSFRHSTANVTSDEQQAQMA